MPKTRNATGPCCAPGGKTRHAPEGSCCDPGGRAAGGFRVESLVTVDERGQMVLPKEVRDKAGIKGGDKLAVVSWEKEGSVCCLSLVKVEELTGMIKGLLGPLMGELMRGEPGRDR